MAGESTFQVEVLTPEGEVFNGEVVQVSTRTPGGEIGILARHVPVLAALQPALLRLHLGDDGVRRYAQAHGWLQVFGNRAMLLIEEAIPPESLDPPTLSEQLSEARAGLDAAEPGSAAEARARRDIERAEAFLQIAEQ